MFASFFNTLFTFNFTNFVGIVCGLILYMTYNGPHPLPPFLFSVDLYWISLFAVAVFHFFLWIMLDKVSFFNIKNRLVGLVVVYLVLMISITCSCSTAFLINTFY